MGSNRWQSAPPPVWTLIYLTVAGVVSAFYPWKAIVDLTFTPLGVLFIVLGFVSAFWAAGIFRREGTEINPTSPEYKKLVVRGPFAITRNPMYLGLAFAIRRVVVAAREQKELEK